MPQRYSRLIPFISLAGDLLLLNLLFIAGFWYFGSAEDCFQARYILFYGYLNVVWFLLASVAGALDLERNSKRVELFFIYLKTSIFFLLFLLLYLQLSELPFLSAQLTTLVITLFFALLSLWKFSLYAAFSLYRRYGFNYRTVLIVGDNPRTRELARFFSLNTWHGYKLIDILSTGHTSGQKRLKDRLEEVMSTRHVDELYLNWQEMSPAEKEDITRVAAGYPVQIRIIPDLGNFDLKTSEIVNYGTIPVIQIHNGPMMFWYNRLLKRLVDLIISGLVIAGVLWWIIPVIYLLSGFGRQGSIWFRQKRTASDGKEFWCFKFRTMFPNKDSDRVQATQHDARITRVGGFLRKSSIDELPQFVNVFLGQMSVVGPRPHMLHHTETYRKLVDSFMIRHTVKPGITGLAQVNGYRGEIRNNTDLEKRVSFDVRYIENWTFFLDLKIMLLTVWLLVRGQKQAY